MGQRVVQYCTRFEGTELTIGSACTLGEIIPFCFSNVESKEKRHPCKTYNVHKPIPERWFAAPLSNLDLCIVLQNRQLAFWYHLPSEKRAR
jgi:hypothetical protein